MVKTIRIVNHKLHSELLKIQGELQAKSGEAENMDSVIRTILKKYGRKVWREIKFVYMYIIFLLIHNMKFNLFLD